MNREELIKIAEQLINNGCSEELKEALEKEYPELAKSEDERRLDGLIEDLKTYANFEERYITSVSEWINGLISLHTDSGWKPTDEQMNALNNARINAGVEEFVVLDSLYAALLKVKNEN